MRAPFGVFTALCLVALCAANEFVTVDYFYSEEFSEVELDFQAAPEQKAFGTDCVFRMSLQYDGPAVTPETDIHTSSSVESTATTANMSGGGKKQAVDEATLASCFGVTTDQISGFSFDGSTLAFTLNVPGGSPLSQSDVQTTLDACNFGGSTFTVTSTTSQTVSVSQTTTSAAAVEIPTATASVTPSASSSPSPSPSMDMSTHHGGSLHDGTPHDSAHDSAHGMTAMAGPTPHDGTAMSMAMGMTPTVNTDPSPMGMSMSMSMGTAKEDEWDEEWELKQSSESAELVFLEACSEEGTFRALKGHTVTLDLSAVGGSSSTEADVVDVVVASCTSLRQQVESACPVAHASESYCRAIEGLKECRLVSSDNSGDLDTDACGEDIDSPAGLESYFNELCQTE